MGNRRKKKIWFEHTLLSIILTQNSIQYLDKGAIYVQYTSIQYANMILTHIHVIIFYIKMIVQYVYPICK